MRAGNPDAAVAFAVDGVEWKIDHHAAVADYQDGQLHTAAGWGSLLDRRPTGGRFSGTGGLQWHVVDAMEGHWVAGGGADLGNAGRIAHPAFPPRPYFPDALVIRTVREVIEGGGVFSYNVGALQDALVADATLAQLRALRAAIRGGAGVVGPPLSSDRAGLP